MWDALLILTCYSITGSGNKSSLPSTWDLDVMTNRYAEARLNINTNLDEMRRINQAFATTSGGSAKVHEVWNCEKPVIHFSASPNEPEVLVL